MKKFLCLALFIFLLIPQVVFAHSHIAETYPADGEVVTEQLTEIELLFDAGIEQHSTITLTNELGEELAIKEQLVQSPALIANLESPLENGTYTVDWHVLGEDGHPTNGTFSFVVDIVEEVEEAPEDSTNNEELVEEDLAIEEIAEEEAIESTFHPLFFVIIALIVVGTLLFFVLRKR